MQEQHPFVIGFATSNAHKLRETEQCLNQLDPKIHLVSLPPQTPVEETGQTFCENAYIKLEATLVQDIPEEITHIIAEDAGLIIDVLEGYSGLSPFPGIYSDRWLTEEIQQRLFGKIFESPTYREKNLAILELMSDQTNRHAQYQAWIACWEKSSGRKFHVTGAMDLKVGYKPSGQNGFGYDPIMIPLTNHADRVIAEMSAEEKNRISHRYDALRKLYEQIANIKV